MFLGIVGVFTPFQRDQFFRLAICMFDLATLALLAASPIILENSTSPLVPKDRERSILIARH